MSVGFETVVHEVTMQLLMADGSPQPLRVVMRYDVADPFAVRLEFHAGGGQQVVWAFGRELLTLGLLAPVGQGDVRVGPSPAPGWVSIALFSPEGEAVVEAEASAVEGFLGHSYAVCAPGAEASHLDVERALTALLDPS